MPCYTQWDAYLNKESDEYKSKKSELHAKLKAIKHIADYYYGAEDLHVPPARHSGQRTWTEMGHLQFEIDPASLAGKDENKIIENIAHHCACDGINFTLLYDLTSLIDHSDSQDCGYARTLLACANEMRANKYKYEMLQLKK